MKKNEKRCEKFQKRFYFRKFQNLILKKDTYGCQQDPSRVIDCSVTFLAKKNSQKYKQKKYIYREAKLPGLAFRQRQIANAIFFIFYINKKIHESDMYKYEKKSSNTFVLVTLALWLGTHVSLTR